jgi:superfamily I DNA/RNA helicase
LLQQIMIYYAPIFKSTYDNFNKRQSDLDSLETISEKYIDLETMLAEMSLDPPTSQDTLGSESDDGESITLSTIHSAKGLEWDTVFILSAVDGYIPSFQSLGDLGQLEEERRLMYVALTRAENNLFIVKPNLDLSQSNHYRFSGIQFSNPSRFLEEHNILADYTEQLTLSDELKGRDSYGFSNNYSDSSSRKKSTSISSKPKKNWADRYNDSWANQELGESDFDDRRKYNF